MAAHSDIRGSTAARIIALTLAATLTACNSGSGAGASNSVSAGSGSGSATLIWQAPATNTDGTPLNNLAGYDIYYGTDRNHLDQTIDVSTPAETTYRVGGLTPGTYYFAVTSYTTDGVESALSEIVSKTLG